MQQSVIKKSYFPQEIIIISVLTSSKYADVSKREIIRIRIVKLYLLSVAFLPVKCIFKQTLVVNSPLLLSSSFYTSTMFV